MEETFTIVLADETEITGKVNGNNYITKQDIAADQLDDLNLIGATINGSTMENMTCCNFWNEDDGTHIVFRQKTDQELANESINAKLEYIAMMADIDLED